MPRIVSNGRNIFYEDQGPRDGAPLVFLPGLGGDHRAFAVVMRHFGKRFRVIGIDHRDVGRSDRAVAPYSTFDMAEDALGVIEAIGLAPAVVVGQSMGGLIAQELVLHSPDRVRGLVLASAHGGPDTWRRVLIESWIALRPKCDPSEFTRLVLPWLVAPSFFEHQAQVDGLIRFAERNEHPQESDAYVRQARAAIAHEARNRLGSIRVPTLVIVGARDLVNPPGRSAELAASIPDARFVELPEVGHLPHIEAGSAFREAVGSFLDDLA